MISRLVRRLRVVLATALLLAPALGCETKSLTIEIPGYGNGEVTGVWIWRQAEATGDYERICRIEFDSSTPSKSGAESLSYLQICPSPDQIGMELTAAVDRLPANPSTIVVKLWFFRYSEPGQYRASSYNSVGESALSPTALAL